MKVQIIFLILFLFSFFKAKGQVLQNRTEIMSSVGVKYLYLHKEGQRYVIVRNTSNKLFNQKSFVPSTVTDYSINDVQFNNQEDQTLKKIIFNSLNYSERSIIKNEFLSILFFISDTGKILELEFFIKPNSKITVDILSKVERGIKQNFDITLKGNSLRGSSYIKFAKVIKLNEL